MIGDFFDHILGTCQVLGALMLWLAVHSIPVYLSVVSFKNVYRRFKGPQPISSKPRDDHSDTIECTFAGVGIILLYNVSTVMDSDEDRDFFPALGHSAVKSGGVLAGLVLCTAAFIVVQEMISCGLQCLRNLRMPSWPAVGFARRSKTPSTAAVRHA